MSLLSFGMLSLVGMNVEFEVITGDKNEVLKGEIKSLEFSDELNTIVFTVVTPYGNVARLTHREILNFVKN